ncbi:MAG: phosphoenolpyruvate carboxykinase (GTP), partial [Lysobacterales bacterium]
MSSSEFDATVSAAIRTEAAGSPGGGATIRSSADDTTKPRGSRAASWAVAVAAAEVKSASPSAPGSQAARRAAAWREADALAPTPRVASSFPQGSGATIRPFHGRPAILARFHPSKQQGIKPSMTTRLKSLRDWVAQVAQLTSPDRIHWCDGTDQEYRKLLDEMLDAGALVELNQSTYPGCYLHRSHPEDVARVEHLTFVCTQDAAEAGPNNNWKSPDEAKKLMESCFAGCMRGRTMYVIPYCMGPIDSPYARCGVEITDSAYVVANMYLMTRIGKPALKRIEKDKTFVKGLHSTGELDPDRRYIMHFPEELTIMSYGSGYGGNALLGKKCHALRIASYQARTEGWLAEHMLIVGVQNPAGDIHYLACAFPSACGKTNLAMLIPPASHKGWKVWTLGDDIAWMHLDADGQLRAINPEAGYFGVVPGTNPQTNRNAYDMIGKDTIFTNVGVTANNDPWWEEKGSGAPATDWKGRPYAKANGPAAHPNARFTVSAKQNPSYSKLAEAP